MRARRDRARDRVHPGVDGGDRAEEHARRIGLRLGGDFLTDSQVGQVLFGHLEIQLDHRDVVQRDDRAAGFDQRAGTDVTHAQAPVEGRDDTSLDHPGPRRLDGGLGGSHRGPRRLERRRQLIDPRRRHVPAFAQADGASIKLLGVLQLCLAHLHGGQADLDLGPLDG